MWAEARHQRIRSLLQRYRRMTTAQAAKELNVSRETVRRDFLELEAMGILKRIRGGVTYVSDEPPAGKRADMQVAAKQAIARLVARDLPAPSTIFIDAGSTTTIAARELVQRSELTIITNSFHVAEIFVASGSAGHNRIIFLPGDVDVTLNCSLGAATVTYLQQFHADIALLSPVTVNATDGAMSFLHDEALVARTMSERAAETWILADHTKIGTTSREVICPPHRIGRLYGDEQVTRESGYTELDRVVTTITAG